MKLDLSKLTDAVSHVAGMASAHGAMLRDHKAAQEAIDTLAASLIAATSSPVEAVGLAAVAAELSLPDPVDPVAHAIHLIAGVKD